MTTAPCPGPCNARYRKAQKAYKKELADYDPLNPETSRPEPPDEHLIRQWGDPVWCTDCQTLVGQQLLELDTLPGLREAQADGHGEAPGDETGKRGKRGKRGKSVAPPSQSRRWTTAWTSTRR